ncbi:sortase [Patescibacteria group bacterium]|nr:sortase [Patescibacteria group bacterium]
MDTKQGTSAPQGTLQNVYARKWTFLVAFLVILFVVVRVFTVIGFVPNPITTTVASNAGDTIMTPVTLTNSPLIANASANGGNVAATNGSLNMNGELPTKVVISSIGVSAQIANPATTNIEALDQSLLSGAARYPTSATLDQQGTVVLFGHSSYLPVVINRSFKTFDGIQNLKEGDQITVYSTTHVFTYAVTGVQHESATLDAIPLTSTGHTLVLATCNSFGQKTDRFVVTATLVGSSALGS